MTEETTTEETSEETTLTPEDLDAMTVAQLKELAADNNINIEGRTRKADIIAAFYGEESADTGEWQVCVRKPTLFWCPFCDRSFFTPRGTEWSQCECGAALKKDDEGDWYARLSEEEDDDGS